MPFDVQGARRAGYSDSEIADFLGAQRKFDVGQARTAGYSDGEILGFLTKNEPKKESTISGEAVRGVKQLISSGRTAVGALTGDAAQAGIEGVQRSQDIGEAAGEGPSLERIKRVYGEKGLIAAGRQVASDIPRAVAGQEGTLASMYALGKVGAGLGSPAGPVGAFVGGATGATAALLPQLFGSNIERQVSEQQAAGVPVDPNLGRAGAAAAGAAALESVGTGLVLGKRVISGLLGISPTQLASDVAKEKLLREASRTLAGGAARGAAVEMPVEVAQSVIERAQAGLDLTSDDALAEYGEAAYGAAIVGGPLGGVGAVAGRGGARRDLAALEAAETPPAVEPTPEAPLTEVESLAARAPTDLSVGELYQEEARLRSLLDEGRQPKEVVDRIREIRKLKREYNISAAEDAILQRTAREQEQARAAQSVFSEETLPEVVSREGFTPPQAITPELLLEAGLPAEPTTAKQKGVAKWLADNIVGRTVEEVQELINREKSLVEGNGLRAKILRELTTVTPKPFEEKEIGRLDDAGLPESAIPELGGDQPSVGLPSGVSDVGGEPATPGTPSAPVDGGVEAAALPTQPGDGPEVREPVAVVQPQAAAPASEMPLKPGLAPEQVQGLRAQLADVRSRMSEAEAERDRAERAMALAEMTGNQEAAQTAFNEHERARAALKSLATEGDRTYRKLYDMSAVEAQEAEGARLQAEDAAAQQARRGANVGKNLNEIQGAYPYNLKTVEAVHDELRDNISQTPEYKAFIEKNFTPTRDLKAGKNPDEVIREGQKLLDRMVFQEGVQGEVPLAQSVRDELDQNNVADALHELSKTTTNPLYVQVARRLMRLLGDTNVVIDDDLRNTEGKPAAGAASLNGRMIWLDRNRGMNEETLLHESVHAASEFVLSRKPADRTAEQNAAVRELDALWEAAKADPDITLSPDARANLSEFVTEALTNPALIKDLQAKPWTFRNAWESFKRTLLKMLGVKSPSTMNEAAIAAMDTIFQPSSMSPGGPQAQRTFQRKRDISPIGFYSALADETLNLPVGSAPAAGWKAAINGLVNKGKVKQDEITWTGLFDWLDLQQGKIPKSAVMDYLNANGVQVEEITLGARAGFDADRYDELTRQSFTRMLTTDEALELGRLEDARFNTRADKGVTATKFGSYTLPGGKNYREVLLTLPPEAGFNKSRLDELNRLIDEKTEGYGRMSVAEREVVRAAIKSMREERSAIENQRTKFKSSHWDQPNVLAHIRLNDRTDADGKRVLFVEEIQSDWAQEGRKKGFSKPPMKGEVRRQEGYDPAAADMFEPEGASGETWAVYWEDGTFSGGYGSRADAEARLRSAASDKAGGVPKAPFVQNTDAWLGLVLKRVITMAAEGGYDRVAFTTGEQNAERFDLSKHVDALMIEENGMLSAKMKGGPMWTEISQNVSESNLADFIGKEAAEKLLARPRQPDGTRTLRGVDLKVGGEGMKAFYDKIIPSALRKLLSKMGGKDLRGVDFAEEGAARWTRDQERSRFEVADEYDPSDVVTVEGYRMYNPDGQMEGWNSSAEQADLMIGRRNAKLPKDMRQPGFDVTSEMRAEVSKGTRLFRLAPNVEAALKSQDARQVLSVGAAIKGAFRQGLGLPGAVNSDIVSTESKVRTLLSDKAATVFDKLGAAVNKGMMSAMDSTKIKSLFKQSEAADQLIPEFLRKGKLALDPTTGLWKVSARASKNAPVKALEMVEAWGKKNGMKSFEDSWEYAARLIESGRQYEFRRQNALAKPGDPQLPVTKGFPIDVLYPAYKADADLQAIKKILDEVRVDLIDNMVSVGRLSAQEGAAWKAAAEYVPFDRLEKFGEKIRQQKRTGRGIAALGKLPELVDASLVDRPVGNALENYFKTLGWMVEQTVRTDALNKTLAQLQAIGEAKAPVRTKDQIQNPTLAVRGFRNGEEIWYEVPTIYHAAAFNAQTGPLPKFLEVFGTVSRILRTSITALPTFTASQLPQDIQRAILYSGVKNPAALTAKALSNFSVLSKHALKGTLYEGAPIQSAFGVVGDVDFRKNDPAQSILEELGFVDRKTLGSKKAGTVLHRLNELARASDIAIRKAIYEQTLEETKDELLALQRAREIINFRSTGSGDPLGILPVMIQTIPFFNAYIQGTDVLYRALTGSGAVSGLARRQALGQFYKMAGALAAGSTVYALMMAGDEEYENMNLDERDRSWVLGDGFSIPVPGEIGMIFKAIPERVVEAMLKEGTPDEKAGMIAISSWFRAAFMEYAGRTVPIPAATKPILEAWTGYSFRTRRQMEGVFQEGLDASRRVTSNTSEFAKEVARFASKTLGLEISPIKIDNTWNGYLGTTGALILASTDSLINPDRADRPLHQMVGLTPFTYNPVGNRRISEFYDLREKVVTAQNTLNTLMKQDLGRAREYVEENRPRLLAYKAVNATLKQLQATRQYKQWLDTPTAAQQMSSEERMKKKQEIQAMEQRIVGWVRMARKELDL